MNELWLEGFDRGWKGQKGLGESEVAGEGWERREPVHKLHM